MTGMRVLASKANHLIDRSVKRTDGREKQHVETPPKPRGTSAHVQPMPEADRIRLLRYAKRLVSLEEFQTVA